MNKQDLVKAVASDTGLSKADSERALVSILENITKAIKNEDITLVGFGTFSKKRREGRTGVNPQTGAKLQIPAKNVVKFKAGKKLKESVN